MTSDGAPGPREGAAVAWTGSAMFVWGGREIFSERDDGALYDPATDVWTSIAGGAAAPSPRSLAAAVWTGTEVLVWGGGALMNTTALGDGARYDPASAKWKSVSNDGAPEPRRGAFAAWTGARVLLWGGYDGGTTVDGGALYDPATDAWTEVSNSGAPPARAGAATVWSGSELFVCGGEIEGGESSECHAYDPVQNKWRSLPEAGAPSARRDAFAAWASGKLVLWGGAKGSGSLDTGALYDPAANAWSPLTNDGNPSKRSRPYRRSGWVGAAGGRALLFAGADGNTPKRDGKLYDPAADAWIDAGSAEKEHDNGAGVWTGAELILWSGRNSNNLDPRGERYKP